VSSSLSATAMPTETVGAQADPDPSLGEEGADGTEGSKIVDESSFVVKPIVDALAEIAGSLSRRLDAEELAHKALLQQCLDAVVQRMPVQRETECPGCGSLQHRVDMVEARCEQLLARLDTLDGRLSTMPRVDPPDYSVNTQEDGSCHAGYPDVHPSDERGVRTASRTDRAGRRSRASSSTSDAVRPVVSPGRPTRGGVVIPDSRDGTRHRERRRQAREAKKPHDRRGPDRQSARRASLFGNLL